MIAQVIYVKMVVLALMEQIPIAVVVRLTSQENIAKWMLTNVLPGEHRY